MKTIASLSFLASSVATTIYAAQGDHNVRNEDNAAVFAIIDTSRTPLLDIMKRYRLPLTREALERFLIHSDVALMSAETNPLYLAYPLIREYVKGMNRFLPRDAELTYISSPDRGGPEVSPRPNDRVVRSFTDPAVKFLGQLGGRPNAIVGSYHIKGVGVNPLESVAVDTGLLRKDGTMGAILSYDLLGPGQIVSMIPDLGVSLILMRRGGKSFYLELWKHGGERLQVAKVRASDHDKFALRLSADRSHFYIVYMITGDYYRITIGSPEPFSQLEETDYKSLAAPVIDGDYLESEGQLTNLASYWAVGKTDYPLPEDLVVRSRREDNKVELVDISRSRLVDIFRRNCMDFGSMLPDTRDVRVMQLKQICSLLTGATRNEVAALNHIDQFTKGMRRSDGDVTRMFAELVEGRSAQPRALTRQGTIEKKKKRPFATIKDSPSVLPWKRMASEILAVFDSEQETILSDSEYKADIDCLAKLFASE